MSRSLLVSSFALALLGCPSAVSTQQPAGDDDGQGGDDGAEHAKPAADDGTVVTRPPGPKLPTGALCDTNADCAREQICEGIGCGPKAGRCVSRDRICTRDLAEYCGCDGKTFTGSGSCPGGRYAYFGACEPQREDGEPCTDGRQCRSKQCLGEGLEGCSPGAQGVCGQAACTRDAMVYCSCNNTEFTASGSCPDRQFAYRGPCEGGAS